MQPKCPKCSLNMSEGYMLEVGDNNVRSAARWVAGAPEPSIFLGAKVKGKEQYAIRSFQCPGCGYLESYAGGTVEAAAE